MSTENHSTESASDVPVGGSHGGGELQSAQQDAEEVRSGTARTAAAIDASSGLGRQTVGPDRDKAALNHPSNMSSELQNEGRPDGDHARSLAEALDLLRASVEHLVAKKRRTTAAAVSLEMRKRSGNTFTPAVAGFTAFREFLRFAEGVGAVALLPPVPGGDVEVLSTTVGGAPDEPVAPSVAAPMPIRRDLWQAFVDWSPQRQRAFDVRTGRVVALPTDKNSGGEVDKESASWRDEPGRFRRITPLSRDDQLHWMRAFASQLSAGEEKDRLIEALGDSHPLTAFIELIRTFPDVERSWRRTFTEQVTSAITRWMRQEQVTADIYHMPSTLSGEPPHRVKTEGSRIAASAKQSALNRHEVDSADELRQQVLEAVARMSLSELLRLPIPAEYLLLR